MAEMRFYELLRAQELTDYTVTWDTTYSKVLLKDNLESATRTTDLTTLNAYDCGLNECGAYSSMTATWIYPFKPQFRTVYDGVARGNMNIRFYRTDTANSRNAKAYADITLKGITSAGVETTFGTTTTNTAYSNTITGNGEVIIDVPFFIEIDNKVLLESQKLVLEVVLYAACWGFGGITYVDLNYAFNTNNLYVEVPIV